MNSGLISSRYAVSLLQYAISLEQQEEVYERIKLFSAIFLKTPRLRSAILNPSIHRRVKRDILFTACGGDVPSSLSEMIDLILKNEREDFFQYIVLRFIELYREKYNIRSGRLITAISIDPETEQQIVDRIRKIAKTEVEMESVVDPGIIGGFVLSLEDYRWDASVSGKLSRIRSQIQNRQL